MTVVSGHSSGELIAAYIAAYGGDIITGMVLEDLPVFSTEPDYFQQSFAYVDTYKVMHDYDQSDKSECWEAYYLCNCYWGNLYMANAMPGLANYTQKYSDNHPSKAVQFFFMPQSINQTFQYVNEYDFAFVEHFYDYSWHAGISREKLMADVHVPAVFIHAKDQYLPDGILMAASSEEQARRAVDLIEDCRLVELKSIHLIHWYHPNVFIDAVNSLSISDLADCQTEWLLLYLNEIYSSSVSLCAAIRKYGLRRLFTRTVSRRLFCAYHIILQVFLPRGLRPLG